MTLLVRSSLAAMLVAAAAPAVHAEPLKVVNVKAPAVWCVFNKDCKVTVSDSVATFKMEGVSGTGALQSRTVTGAKGTPGAGVTAYLFRVDLSKTVGHIAHITGLVVDFGPDSKLDYDKSGTPADVFVVNTGAAGVVGIKSADRSGNVITFEFAQPLSVGPYWVKGAPGQSSYFFGLSAAQPPKKVTAQVKAGGSGNPPLINVDARVPTH